MQPGDYTLTTGTLMIPPMTASDTIAVPVVGETTVEPDETFTVNLSVPMNATIADGTATGTILDDDATPPFTVTADVCCFECVAGGKATFRLTITPTSPVTSPVSFSCTSGLPPLSTCTLSPSTLNVGSSPATAVLLIETTGPAGSPSAGLRATPNAPTYALWLTLGGMGLVGMVVRRDPRRCGGGLAVVGLLALTLAGLSCSDFSGPRTQPGTYDVLVTATSGNDSQDITLRVIVQP